MLSPGLQFRRLYIYIYIMTTIPHLPYVRFGTPTRAGNDGDSCRVNGSSKFNSGRRQVNEHTGLEPAATCSKYTSRITSNPVLSVRASIASRQHVLATV